MYPMLKLKYIYIYTFIFKLYIIDRIIPENFEYKLLCRQTSGKKKNGINIAPFSGLRRFNSFDIVGIL